MLNEEGKFRLRRAVRVTTPKMLEKARADGPAKVIQSMLDIAAENKHLSHGAVEAANHLAENREEAERYMAGLLGMA